MPIHRVCCYGVLTLSLLHGNDRPMAPGWSQLHQAAQQGSVRWINTLVSTGWINIDEGGPKGVTPLMLAADRGQARAAKALLNNGADVSLLTDGGLSALTMAVDNGHVAAVLLEAGASPESKTEREVTTVCSTLLWTVATRTW